MIIFKKILYIILNLSIVIIEIITYFIFKPKDIASFFFIWLLLSIIILVYSVVKGSPTGIHVFTSSLGSHNNSMRYLNLSTEMENKLNGEKKENVTFVLERNLFTIIKILMILVNLIIYIVLVKGL